MPACPHCGEPLTKQGISKMTTSTGYYCKSCGQHFTKVKGEKGWHKGQPVNLPIKYFRGKV